MKKYILTLTFFVTILITGELSIFFFAKSENEKIQKKLDYIGNNISKSIQEEIDISISATTMNELMLKTHDYNTSQFEDWAKLILSNYKSINNIQLAPNGVVQNIYPLDGNEKAIGHDLLKDPKRRVAALKALKSAEITFIGPIKLIQNGKLAIIVRKPISKKDNDPDTFWGFSTVLILVDEIVEKIIKNFDEESFNYAIYGNNPDAKKAPLLKASQIKPEKNIKIYPITVPNGTWNLHIQSKESQDNNMLIFSIFILAISFVSSYFVFKYLSSLDQENQKFKVLLRNATDGVHILDLKGNLIDCSNSFHNDLGYSYEEILKLKIQDWDDEITPGKLEGLLDEIVEENNLKLQTVFTRKDGSVFDVEIIATIVEINNKKYIYASSRDISQRLSLKRRLEYEKDLLDTLFDNVDAIVATIKPDGTMNRVNKFTENITGFSEEQIASRPYFWFDNFIPLNIKLDIKTLIETLSKNGNMIAKKENEWIVKDGQRRLFEWSNKVIHENDKSSFLLTVGIDITDRKNLELELKDINENLEQKIQEATKKLNHSLEIIEKYVITSKTDLNGVITEVSKRFCEVSKFSKDELLGQTHNIIRHEDMPDSLFADIWNTIKNGATWYGRIKNKNKDGQAYWVDSIISPLYDENNVHVGYFSHRFDVTEEIKNIELQQNYNKKLEKQVKEQLEEIRQKDIKMLDQARLASMGEMLSNIAHQWRQPLNVISLCSSGIAYSIDLGGMSKEEIKTEIKYIQESCEYLTKTIETFSKYLRKDKVYAKHSIKNEIESAKYIISTSLKNNFIELIDEVDYSNNYKCFMVENELSQVILNILSNAEYALREHAELKNKWIKLTSKEENNSLIVMIEDNAGGVKEDIISTIFEPYVTTKFKSQGTGLGLSMSHSIMIDSIKGDIYVKNTENGAKFYLEIPLSK